MKKPWNVINPPIYSLATYEGERVNMNICTYVTAVSLKPKQFAIAVYEKTKSLENLRTNNTAVLQLLHTSHINLINILGKKIGTTYDKNQYLRKYNHLEKWDNIDVLKNTCALLFLKKRWLKITGDHTLFLFDIVASQTFNSDILTLQDLRDKKLVRI